MAELHFIHPDRSVRGFRPIKAWRHFRKLIANKEDTEQVFHIVNALRGGRFIRDARAFWNTEFGRKTLSGPQNLADYLDDHDRLKALPEGTVGRVYVEFMEREGLTANGLVAEHEKFMSKEPRFDDVVQRYGNRLRDTHDLMHILTGYGRDALGEQCVLAFSFSMNGNAGIFFIAYAGGWEVKKTLAYDPGIMAAIREGQRNGRGAINFAREDIAALLAEPIEVARARLNIPEPTLYNKVHRDLRAHGIDPYTLIATAA